MRFFTFFSPIFSKYVLLVRKKIVSTNKLINILKSLGTSHFIAVLELLSQSSNFARITILQNGIFHLYLANMFFSTVTNCIHQFIGGYNLLVDTIFFRTGRTYLLNIGGKKVKKTPFRKIVILAKLLLCEMSSSTDNKMRSHQTLRNINHFIGGLNLLSWKGHIC